MIRRFNYTGRRRIERQHVSIDVRSDNSIVLADCRLELSSYDFPPEADVFLEAYRSGRGLVRYRLGPVAPTICETNIDLSELHDDVGLLFRVKVLLPDPRDGRLLGFVRQIRPGESAGGAERRSLLPVRTEPMDGVLWRVVPDFDTGPWLEVNSSIPDWQGFVREDWFMAVALPSAVREVLMHLLVLEQPNDQPDEGTNQFLWMQFMHSLSGVPLFDYTSEYDTRVDWIDQAVASFAEHIGVRDILASHLDSGDE